MTNLNKLFFAIACLLVLAPISSCETTQGTSKDSNNRQSFKQPPIVKEEKKEVNVPPQNQSDNKVEETASALNLPECRKENAPGWWPTPPTNHPDYVFIVGAGLEAKSLVAGKEKAIEDAKKKLYALAGKDGFELPPMNLDFAGDERPDFPCKTSADAKFLNFYKMIAIKRADYASMLAKMKKLVVVGGVCADCQSNAWLENEKSDLSGRLNKQGKGVALVSELLNKDQTTKLLGGESGKADWSFLSEVFTSMKAFKAVVFKIEQDKPMDATPEGAFFYYLRGYMQVIDLADGRVVNTYSTEVVKGGGFNKKAAWDKALDDLRQEFLMNMAMVDF